MVCSLYVCNDNAKKLDKTLTDETLKEILFLDKQDIEFVTLRLKGLNETSNYCKLELNEKNRYYFIQARRILNNGLYELDLVQDVLMTFNAEIKSANGLLLESDLTKNDSNVTYQKEKNEVVSVHELNNPFTSKTDILVTAYGGSQ